MLNTRKQKANDALAVVLEGRPDAAPVRPLPNRGGVFSARYMDVPVTPPCTAPGG